MSVRWWSLVHSEPMVHGAWTKTRLCSGMRMTPKAVRTEYPKLLHPKATVVKGPLLQSRAQEDFNLGLNPGPAAAG